MKKFLVVYFIVVFIISSFVVVNVRGDVLVDSRMGHQKDSGYRSERLAVDVVPGMVVRPEARCSNDGGRSNRHNQKAWCYCACRQRVYIFSFNEFAITTDIGEINIDNPIDVYYNCFVA